jgi:hypothetical protein
LEATLEELKAFEENMLNDIWIRKRQSGCVREMNLQKIIQGNEL